MVEALLEECRTRSLSRQGQLEAAAPPSTAASAAGKPQTPQKKKSAGGLPEKERSREEGRKRQEKDLEREARRDRERRDRRDRERVREREWEREERRKRDRDLGWRGEDERGRRDRERYEGSRTQREGSSGSKSSGISEGSRLSSRRDGSERSMAEKVHKVRKRHNPFIVTALETLVTSRYSSLYINKYFHILCSQITYVCIYTYVM